MKTYRQEKIGLPPIYVKGVVMDDGIHVRPLNIKFFNKCYTIILRVNENGVSGRPNSDLSTILR